ncbi:MULTISPECIES: EamA family transporter RarD [Herbaspirillum]|jgi:chloramphenicol-sensitive protein RarD|uniref:EamA family transporter RarD n=1 Tax=Herbaspirillum huttiense subsp. lycopersici TaxID=3074428 RepID=A0ABU2EJK3_9BURK|nr:MULTISPECIES: EamA family transporter RarD [Herbaspirillum]MCO4855626.1 EamA family transporter RarD [Herbaspirillum sp. WGmk3]MCP3657496.1 EamA family transporter RarD [Herbaspirillum sp.]MCP3949668.1 EamA family transporter RarD [Herbaspirillum sp.]MCP4034919.1 EamA family transporter RarD [Herbaspirillum sp.]MCP4556398.1 EamA family transporter RarD [Herbaspirillum sp.]
MNPQLVGRGIGLSVLASSLFAFLSGYTRLLAPLDGTDIFAWRILITLLCVLGLLAWRGELPRLRAAMAELLASPARIALLVLMAALLALQQWLFLWGSVNGRALEVSLGYFMLPLSMVLVGRFHYGEKMDLLQRLAVLCACVGVAHELWMTRAFSWPTLAVALGYPPYFMLRRRIRLDSMLIFAVELMVLALPSLLALVLSPATGPTLRTPAMWLLLPGLGILSMIALTSYLRAGKLLPMGLFGILGYVEPVLLVLVAMAVLGESLQLAQLGTYVPIWLSVLLTALHSVKLMRRPAAQPTN